MPRYTVRRRRPINAEATPSGVIPVAIGLTVGATVGFLLAEWLGPVAARVMLPRTRPIPARSMAELVHDAQSVLVADLQLREWQLDVAPVGRGRIELRGWVGSRAARTRAARLVSEAVSAEAVLNSILVRGEDDLPESYPDHVDEDMASA